MSEQVATIDFNAPTTTAPVRTILKDYGIGRTVACGKFGNYPIFIAQEIVKALGHKPGRKEPDVSTIDIEVEYGNPEKGYLAYAFYSWAQSLPVVSSARDYALTLGEIGGRKVACLIFRETGMSVPFYI